MCHFGLRHFGLKEYFFKFKITVFAFLFNAVNNKANKSHIVSHTAFKNTSIYLNIAKHCTLLRKAVITTYIVTHYNISVVVVVVYVRRPHCKLDWYICSILLRVYVLF